MNKNTGLVVTGVVTAIGLLGFGLYKYFSTQAKLLKDFDYKIIDFGIDKSNLQIIKGRLKVLFTSKSDIEVTVEQFIVNFNLNGVKIGYIEDNGSFLIPANSSSILEFDYTLQPQLVFTNFVDLVMQTIQNQGDQRFEIDGYAVIKSGFIKVNMPIKYNKTLKEILTEP